MDKASLIGIIIGLICFGFVAMHASHGHLEMFFSMEGVFTVIGGSISVVFMSMPMEKLLRVPGYLKAFMFCKAQSPAETVELFAKLSEKARRDGILALEKVAPAASDQFLAKALMMAVDGADSASLRETMEIGLSQLEEGGEDSAKVFEAAGGYSPTVGIIGAVLGLIHVMSNLSDINAVGSGIAAAFVATIYGVAAANIVFLPFAGRIKMMVRDEVHLKTMMLTGVLAIQEGLNPKLVRERLMSYVHSPHAEKGAAAAGAPATAG